MSRLIYPAVRAVTNQTNRETPKNTIHGFSTHVYQGNQTRRDGGADSELEVENYFWSSAGRSARRLLYKSLGTVAMVVRMLEQRLESSETLHFRALCEATESYSLLHLECNASGHIP